MKNHLFSSFLKVYTHYFGWLVIALYALVAVGIMRTQLQQHYPALIDDGTDLLLAKQLSAKDLFAMELFGQQRTWPLRMQYREMLYTAFGENIEWHFGFNAALLFALVLLLNRILTKLEVSKEVAAVAPVFVVFLPSVYEAFYRLGPMESIQTVTYLAALYALFCQQYLVGTLLFSLNLWHKETSVFYLIPLFLHLLLKRKKALLFIAGGVLTAFAMLIWYKTDHVSGSYVSQSRLSLEFIVHGFNWRSWSFYLLLINFVLLFNKSKSSLDKDTVLAAYLSTFIPYFIWDVGQQYYYQLPNHILGLLCLVFLSYDTWRDSGVFWKWLKLGFVAIVLFWQLVTTLIPHSLAVADFWYKEYVIGGKLVGFLLDNNLSNTKFYIAVRSFERHDKVFIYATEWRGRTVQVNPDPAAWAAAEADQAKLDMLSDQATQNFLLNPGTNKVLISDQYLTAEIDNLVKIPICTDKNSKRKDCWYYIFYPKDASLD